ncbi:MAG: Uncharacterized protein G01um101420_776 [Parcubacteria group bacterium Gr01-1014_20]|nr:MAG: Uncharacterized protein G01um101420_776 [Parcubacteria group bacterium Gr01-1014_20]
MNEFYFSEAVVLSKEPIGEADVRVSLYAKNFGRILARAKSARKITSKLAAHLEPGNLIKARVIEQGGVQVVDALKIRKVDISPANLHYLDQILADGDYDEEVWNFVSGAVGLHWGKVLRALGWDPSLALCHSCEVNRPAAFEIASQNFFCSECVLNFTVGEGRGFKSQAVNLISIS